MVQTRSQTANLKRLVDLCISDKKYRDSFFDNPEKILKESKLQLDAEKAKDVVETRLLGTSKLDSNDYLDLLNRFYQNKHDALMESITDEDSSIQKFRRWCVRQKNWNIFGSAAIRQRVKNKTMYFPPIAFELTKGCSGGCPFCCFDPQSLEGCFSYDSENVDLWNSVLIKTKNLLGNFAGSAPCYYGTEPFDNPDYEKFINHFYQVFERYPQTTTVKAIEDVNRTKNLLRMLGEDHLKYSSVRFSVTSKKQLEEIHRLFTPEELIHIDLMLNNPESLLSYTLAGRAVNLKDKLPEKNFISNFSSACVIGFIVNMVQHTISLTSPRTTEVGFKIYDTVTFTDGESYENALYILIDKWMKDDIPLDKKISNNNVKYEYDGDYLVVRGDKIHRKVSLSEKEYQSLMLVLEGQTFDEVFKELHFTEYERRSTLELMQFMYDKGYIDID